MPINHSCACILALVTFMIMMALAFEVSFTQLAALLNGERCFPVKTPKRWQLIAEYVQKAVSDEEKTGNGAIMVIGCSKKTTTFQLTADHCKQLYSIVNASYKAMLNCTELQKDSILFTDPSDSAFKPIVLLPRTLSCCGHAVFIK